MKKIAILFSTFFLSSCSIIDNQNDVTTNLAKSISDLVNNPIAGQTEISGLQLVLIKNGKIVYEQAEGIARIAKNGSTTALSINHKVRVASISKFVLTLAFMSLVEDGRVKLDEDISSYLGYSIKNPNFPDTKITARQLLTHVSSIRDAGKYFLPLGENFRDFFQPSKYYGNGHHFASKDNEAPGKYFTYANLNFGIIAGVIENVSGKRFDYFVKERLFTPLNLNISFNVCDLAKDNFQSLATLFRRGDGGETWAPNDPWKPQVDSESMACFYGGSRFSRNEKPLMSDLANYKIGANPTLFSPQGGLRASARDLAIIMQHVIAAYRGNSDNTSQRAILQSSIVQMLKPVWQYDEKLNNGQIRAKKKSTNNNKIGLMTAYGLSTHIIDLKDWGLEPNTVKYYGHHGSAYGLLGQFLFDPLTGDGVVALITGLGSDPTIPSNNTPLQAIEETVLLLALDALKSIQ